MIESALTTLTDEEVVARVLRGEVALFEVLMRRHNQKIYRAARAILKNDSEAEDVMQEAYVRAYTHLAEFEGRSALSTWLVRIAVHEAWARSSRQKRMTDLDDTATEGTSMTIHARGPEDLASDQELRSMLEAAVDTLPEHFRLVFVLRAVEGRSVEETAEVLEIPGETVKTRLHRARGLLRSSLTERIGTEVPALFAFHRERCDRVVHAVLRRIQPDPLTRPADATP